MKTSATNKRIRELITGIRNKTMIPRPEFQRRLVWTTKDKRRFLDSVLRGFPFPEIYTAAGAIDPDTGDGTELLVDGQQRVTLPKKHHEYAGIDGKVTIVGMIDHIEFWNPEEFDKYLGGHTESYEEVAAQVMGK